MPLEWEEKTDDRFGDVGEQGVLIGYKQHSLLSQQTPE